MIKLLLRQTNGEVQEQEIQNGMNFQPLEGEQFYFVGAKEYSFTLSGDWKSVVLNLDDNGQKIKLVLENVADLIKSNNPADVFSLVTALEVSSTPEGDAEILNAISNPNLQNGQIVDLLKSDFSTSAMAEIDGAIIDDFGSLAESLDATAAGGSASEAFLSVYEDRNQEVTSADDSSRGTRLEGDTDTDTDVVGRCFIFSCRDK